jgi:hypothetical protein
MVQDRAGGAGADGGRPQGGLESAGPRRANGRKAREARAANPTHGDLFDQKETPPKRG